MLEHRDMYGQAQVCSKGHQGSSVNRPCQPSFEAEMEATLEEGEGPVRKDTSRFKKKNPKEKPVWITVPSPPHGEPRY